MSLRTVIEALLSYGEYLLSVALNANFSFKLSDFFVNRYSLAHKFQKRHEFICFSLFKVPVKTAFYRTIMSHCVLLHFTGFSQVTKLWRMLISIVCLYHDEKYKKIFYYL